MRLVDIEKFLFSIKAYEDMYGFIEIEINDLYRLLNEATVDDNNALDSAGVALQYCLFGEDD